MTVPSFADIGPLPIAQLRALVSDRLRIERKRMKMSQVAFAAKCGISVRTYKRFELGDCNSLEVFLLIVQGFGRIAAIDLVFPAPESKAKPRTPIAALERLNQGRSQG